MLARPMTSQSRDCSTASDCQQSPQSSARDTTDACMCVWRPPTSPGRLTIHRPRQLASLYRADTPIFINNVCCIVSDEIADRRVDLSQLQMTLQRPRDRQGHAATHDALQCLVSAVNSPTTLVVLTGHYTDDVGRSFTFSRLSLTIDRYRSCSFGLRTAHSY